MSIASIALNRFGLGARPDEPVPADPRRWLVDQLSRYEPKPPPIAEVPGSAQAIAVLRAYQEARREARQAAPAASPAGAAAPTGKPPTMPMPLPQAGAARDALRDAYIAQARARIDSALTTPTPFAERLVHFWANHFAVSADKQVSLNTAGLLEFEAIRPHVTGRFADMLLAVERHPAMLLYLDQAQSVGPNSPLGQRVAARQPERRVGLNENLAREIMELHTLGVGSGYTQGDVTEFARAMTGWSIGGYGRLGGQGTPGGFAFVPALHEPGTRTILGRDYAQAGEAQAGAAQAGAVLADLAASPATARHIATKLARHFVADDPPPALVARLSQSFVRTGGDLKALSTVLLDSPEAWAAGGAKFKSPWDWSISALRGLGARAGDARTIGLLGELGQPIWRPGSPAGWGDTTATWAGPDELVRRVEIANRLATLAGDKIDARALGPKLMPGAFSPATAQAIARADSGTQALAMLLVSPRIPEEVAMDRRQFLLSATGAALLARSGLALAAADTDKRLVVIILRGAMDGVGAVIPSGDPAYAAARAQLALANGIALDGTFALHPAMARTAAFYKAGQALAVHAVASPYRDRSHFDGQNVLECGGVGAYTLKDGWLNRALPLLPGARAIAIAPTVPPLLQGVRPVESYAPSRASGATPDLLARVGGMYEADPMLHGLWEQALAARQVSGGAADDGRGLPGLAALAARFLAAPGGARVAVLESLGWDTHAGQTGRLAAQLGLLDAAFGALADGLGAAWRETVVIAVTEFGRTVAANGTGGTDHGTASAAFLVGGAVKGGRVLADWPGLAPGALYEGRDLRPTTNLHAVLTGLVSHHYGVEPGLVQRTLFPVTRDGTPVEGLLRA